MPVQTSSKIVVYIYGFWSWSRKLKDYEFFYYDFVLYSVVKTWMYTLY